MTSSDEGVLPRAVALLPGIVLCAVSLLVYLRFFAGHLWLVPAMGAVVAPALLVLIGASRGWPLSRLVALAVLLVVPYVVYTLYPQSTYFGLPDIGTLRSTWSGLTQGWAGLLTFGLPAPPIARLVAPILVMTCAVSFATAWLALRARGVLTPVLPALAAFVVAVALTATRSGSALVLTAAFVLGAALQAVARSGATGGTRHRALIESQASPRRGTQVGKPLGVGLVLAPVLVASAVAGVALSGGSHPARRADPRNFVHPPAVVISGVNPLAQVEAQQLTRPAQRLFTLQLRSTRAEPVTVDQIRLVALGDFDGAVWQVGDTFEPVGSTLPTPESFDPTNSTRLDEKVTVRSLPEPFIPTAGQPVHGDGPKMEFDPLAGNLLSSATPSGGYTYVGWSEVTRPSDAQLAVAGPYRERGAARFAALPPGTPAAVTNLARKLGGGGHTTAISELRSIEHYLKTTYRYRADGPPGSTVASLQEFLFHSKAGQSEQFAGAFALLARSLGLPARVAVGYRLDSTNQVGPGTYEVTTSDASAWPEVDFEHYGWIAFNPLDTSRTNGAPPSQRPDDSHPTKLVEAPTRAVTPRDLRPTPVPVSAGPGRVATRDTDASLVLTIVLAGGALLVAAGSAATGILAAKSLRRLRRRRGPPAERIFGAWSEICDHLASRGVEMNAAQTPAETVDAASPFIGAAASSRLAAMEPIISATTYSPVPPDDKTAERAWVLEGQTREIIDHDSGFIERCRTALDPRTLSPARLRVRRARLQAVR